MRFLIIFIVMILLALPVDFCFGDSVGVFEKLKWFSMPMKRAPTDPAAAILPLELEVSLPKSVRQKEEFNIRLKVVNRSALSFRNLRAMIRAYFYDEKTGLSRGSLEPKNTYELTIGLLGGHQSTVLSWDFQMPRTDLRNAIVDFIISSNQSAIDSEGKIFKIEQAILKPHDLSISSHYRTDPALLKGVVWADGSKDIFIDGPLRRGCDGCYLVGVQNSGDVEAKNVKIDLIIDGVIVSSDSVDVAAGGTSQSILRWKPCLGVHHFEVHINPDARIDENRIDDNRHEWDLYIGPDFAVSEANISPPSFRAGDDIIIDVRVDDMGITPEGGMPLEVGIYFDDKLISMQQVDISEKAAMKIMAPLYTWQVRFNEKIPMGVRAIAIRIDPENKFKEMRKDNNVKVISVK